MLILTSYILTTLTILFVANIKRISPFLMFSTIFFVTAQITLTEVVDVDGWWHIQCGSDLLSGHIDYGMYYWSTVIENYSDLKFTWLGDIVLFLIYDNFGSAGLVVSRSICVMLCCFFLWLVSDRKPNFFKMCLFLLVIVASYQKMLIRNSMFALVFFPATLYLFKSKQPIKAILTIALWSQMHGSFLIGMAVSVFFLNKKTIIPVSVAVIIGLSLSPVTKTYLTPTKISQAVKNGPAVLFGTNASNKSIEFKNPFDYASRRNYIKVAIAMPIIAIILVSPLRAGYILPWLAVCFFGIYYIRLLYYMAVVSVFSLFIAEKGGHIRKVSGMSVFIMFIMLASVCVFYPGHIRYNITKFGFTEAKIKYDTPVLAYALKKYPDENTFAGSSLGGWALLNWHPRKKVFIGTHWAPHSQALYDMEQYFYRNPDKLKEICDTAIIQITDFAIFKNFLKHKWYPEAMDRSCILFSKYPVDKFYILLPDDYNKIMTKQNKIFFYNILKTLGIKTKLGGA